MLALRKRQAVELVGDVLRSGDLLPLEGEHGILLIQRYKGSSIDIEGGVVVVHERLGQRVGVHPECNGRRGYWLRRAGPASTLAASARANCAQTPRSLLPVICRGYPAQSKERSSKYLFDLLFYDIYSII